jgi:hypothetical protein
MIYCIGEGFRGVGKFNEKNQFVINRSINELTIHSPNAMSNFIKDLNKKILEMSRKRVIEIKFMEYFS